MESRVIVAEALKPVDVACCAQTVALGFSPGAKWQWSTKHMQCFLGLLTTLG